MIESVQIKNFRGFKNFEVGPFAPINVIVGDNGAGKTALLEAMFLTLTTNPNKALLLRQYRGIPNLLAGPPEQILESIYSDLFYELSSTDPASITLRGSTYENRSLTISRGPASILLKPNVEEVTGEETKPPTTEILSPIIFEWIDEHGQSHLARTKITGDGLEFESAGADVPICFFYPAQSPIPAKEVADRLSAMRIEGSFAAIRKSLLRVFDQIEDISPEAASGLNEVFAAVPGLKRMIPLASVSGGITRSLAIMTALSFREGGIVFVDEMEQGVYYKRHHALLREVLRLARQNKTQLFVSTHDDEWLRAFMDAAGKTVSDIAFWRLTRQIGGPKVQRIAGSNVNAMLEYGEEPR